jgi:hypothetical protein
MFATAWAWLTSKLSLVLGYISIGVAIALGCAAIWFYHQNKGLNDTVVNLQTTSNSLRSDVTSLQNYNNKQDAAIADLVQQRQNDGAIVQGLIDDYKDLTTESASTKAKIRDLERKSDEVKSYLSGPLPASVRSVLNGQDQPASASSAAGANGSRQTQPAAATSH